ncbi:MAG TPA: DUF899 domain-containing protein [Chthoniobacterales bacterium]|nr:DUF899 domain-containing protein [Chthoniobacterales bacterium]
MSTTLSEPEKQQRGRKIVSREEWLEARKELLDAEKEHTRRSDALALWRQELPWVRIDKDYRFETEKGSAKLSDLFDGRSQLMIYHFMYGPEFSAGCPSCSSIADSFDGFAIHLANHDVAFSAVSRAPLATLQAYKQRMGWRFPWASSSESDFNYDFHASHTKEQEEAGTVEYNFSPAPRGAGEVADWMTEFAGRSGTDWATYARESPGMSSFVLEDGIVYHTYSAYSRGLDGLWNMYQWLDRAPFGRNESGIWFRRHDEYGTPAEKGGSCCCSA